MILLAIDPGSTQSAWLTMDELRKPCEFAIEPNEALLVRLRDWLEPTHLAIETMFARGMPTAQEEFETQLWAGRFIEAFQYGEFTQVRRMDVKLVICGSVRAKDGNLRQALIDQFGGKAMAIGTKRTPGPLHGIANDVWSALAIATWWWSEKAKAA